MTTENHSPVFQTTKRIRIGIWGLGRGMSIRKTCRSMNMDIVAGCDFNPHFLQHFREAFPDGRFTADMAEFLSLDFDAVLLATFCPDHADHAIQCLVAGKHVLSEVTSFHTMAEGVRLVETVERTGCIYQLAENYPFMPTNRYLARKWREGLFGEFIYGEYSYLHDCLDLAYTYIDGTPVEPGYAIHNWRSWLPWHYYNTHSLGPVMLITGLRPVRVTALPGRVRLPGHPMETPGGLAGAAPSLIEFENGGIMRNLMGGMTGHSIFGSLYGTRGSSEWMDDGLYLRLGGRGHSKRLKITPDMEPLDRTAAETGHGGGDFWVLYHFANEIMNGIPGPFDVYTAADCTITGIQAHRSALEGGQPKEIPDFRLKEDRDKYRDDDFSATRIDTEHGMFPKKADTGTTGRFTTLIKDLLVHTERVRSGLDWLSIADQTEEKGAVVRMVGDIIRNKRTILDTVRESRELADAYPESEGARVLNELLLAIEENRIRDPEFFEDLIEKGNHIALKKECALIPQLRMRRPQMNDLPPVVLPEGFSIRNFEDGDEDAWISIINEAFGEKFNRKKFLKMMGTEGALHRDRIFLVLASDGIPCATASAYERDSTGYVHYVAARQRFQGLGLGYQVSLRVLHKFRDLGFDSAELQTDDFRYAAIKIYWNLGFHPVLVHPNQEERWQRMADRMKLPGLLTTLENRQDT